MYTASNETRSPRGLIGRIGRHPETQIVLGFETRAHTKTHYHRYQLRTGTNRQCHGRMQSELWRVPLGPTTLSLSSRDVCAALPVARGRCLRLPCGVWIPFCVSYQFWLQRFVAARSVHSLASSLAVLHTAQLQLVLLGTAFQRIQLYMRVPAS